LLLRDHDAKYTRNFDDVFCAEVLLTPVQAPNANAHAQRWIRRVRAECLDWLLIVGRGRLEQVLRDYVSTTTPTVRTGRSGSSRPIQPSDKPLPARISLSAHRAIEYTVARTILDTSARWSRFKVAAVSVVLW